MHAMGATVICGSFLLSLRRITHYILMKSSVYAVTRLGDSCYKFVSNGRRGSFEMRILFTRYLDEPEHALFNLAFGVWNPVTCEIDDSVEVRNGDMDRILATVGRAALMFLEENPEAYIYAEGSTLARTRKYQMGITANLTEILDGFALKGLPVKPANEDSDQEVSWERFRVGVNYSAFLLYAK
jgi:hypothetical protein